MAVLDKKNIFLYNINSTSNPFQLVFENKYGSIVDYCLYGDGYIVVAFAHGYICHVSTHSSEMNQEISSKRPFNKIDAICANEELYKCAIAAETDIKIMDMTTWKELTTDSIRLPPIVGRITQLEWSNNGQLLLVSTIKGYLIGLLTHLPRLVAVYHETFCVLTSFSEVGIYFTEDLQTEIKMAELNLEFEPTNLDIGPFHIASAINTFAHFYKYRADNFSFIPKPELQEKSDFFARITDIKVGGYFSAVLTETNCYLVKLTDPAGKNRIKFPPNQEDPKIRSIELSDDFLLMLNVENKITIYSLLHSAISNELKPSYEIVNLFPNKSMTKAVCIDKQGNGWLLNFLSERSIKIDQFQPRIRRILWDSTEPNQFIGTDKTDAYSYIYNRNNYRGEQCHIVKEILDIEEAFTSTNITRTVLFKDHIPIILKSGQIATITPDNRMSGMYLVSHSAMQNFTGNPDDESENQRYFFQNLSLCKFQLCLSCCHLIGENEKDAGYSVLAEAALKNLNVKISRKAYQLSGNISMVHSLGDLLQYEEKLIIQGMVAMIYCDYTLAQEFFLKSSNPKLALELRCDIQDWNAALELSKSMAKDEIKFIQRHLAEDNERKGNNPQALKLFEISIAEEKGLSPAERIRVRENNILCSAGIARTSIKTGNLSRGVGVAMQLTKKELISEIASCCESMKNFEEAANLFEKAEQFERAATLYIAQKQFSKAEKLIANLNSPKILTSLAKMKEKEGNFREAELAFERARDWENVIRINLDHMGNYEKALRLYTEKAPTQACAGLLASYCDLKGMRKESILFLVYAGKQSEAFSKAGVYQEMEAYADALEEVTEEEALKIAQYFEGINNYKEAGRFYEIAEQFNNSLEAYLNAGEDAIELAILMISKCQSELLFNKMLDYLEGVHDNEVKDTKYAFKLYLAFGRIEDACLIAIAIVDKELEDGNYKDAHNLLFQLMNEIIEKKVKVSYELLQKTIIIHSYIIAKKLIKIGEHSNAAKMLNRVCENISQFPKHASAILVTTIIEASKSNLKATAFKWAAMACRGDHLKEVNPKTRKKIENVARKPVKEEPRDEESACPFCNKPFSSYELSCPNCMNNVPFCIASGKHITTSNICMCPHCESPAFTDMMQKVLEIEPNCPMCQAALTADSITTDIKNPAEYIKSLKVQNNQKEGVVA